MGEKKVFPVINALIKGNQMILLEVKKNNQHDG